MWRVTPPNIWTGGLPHLSGVISPIWGPPPPCKQGLNVRLKAAKNLLSQSAEYYMHCVNYAKREQEKPLMFKLTLRSRSTLSQAQSDSCHELLVVFGLSTLNSNRTNHKPRKKLANQKRRHMSLRLCGIQTRIRRRSIQKV